MPRVLYIPRQSSWKQGQKVQREFLGRDTWVGRYRAHETGGDYKVKETDQRPRSDLADLRCHRRSDWGLRGGRRAGKSSMWEEDTQKIEKYMIPHKANWTLFRKRIQSKGVRINIQICSSAPV